MIGSPALGQNKVRIVSWLLNVSKTLNIVSDLKETDIRRLAGWIQGCKVSTSNFLRQIGLVSCRGDFCDLVWQRCSISMPFRITWRDHRVFLDSARLQIFCCLWHTISWYWWNFPLTQPLCFYLAADVTPVLLSGHKKYGALKNERAL